MDFSEWKALSDGEQKEKCQWLDPQVARDVFKGVENEFLEKYGDQPGVDSAHCGYGPFIGPMNCIVVNLSMGETGADLPEEFLGFPVMIEGGSKV